MWEENRYCSLLNISQHSQTNQDIYFQFHFADICKDQHGISTITYAGRQLKMEDYKWQTLFETEKQELNMCGRKIHVWSFCVDEHLQVQQGYLQYTQRTFARFQCSHCCRWWNSAQVHILFLIRLDAKSRCGTVKMKIFRQRCRRCNVSTFEKAEISEGNSKRVIINLISKIQSKFYERKNTRPPLEPEVYSDVVEGPHEKKYCEACKMQVCHWNTVSEDKTMTVMSKPETFYPRATSRVYEQDNTILWPTETYGTSRPTRAVYQSPDNENVNVFLMIIVLFLIAAWLSTLDK
ncbi:receptor-transporting protein 3-like [Dendrobates tinctorius]|uniref:receptor-transporting protein 3-like n=1 Tax=Dendrobates tinctorius TaxID=92724 RepID=UPI003CCA1651